MSSLLSGITNEPLLAGLDRPKFSIVTIKGLIREALAELISHHWMASTTTSLSLPLFAEIKSDD